MTRTRATTLRITAAAALVLIGIAAPAGRAATVGFVDGIGIVLTAAPGERNVVTAEITPAGRWLFRDTGASLQALSLCVQVDPHTADCQSTSFHHSLLGDGDDQWRGHGTVSGGAGNDVLVGAGFNVRLEGQDGDDTLRTGERCCTTMDGGSGSDLLVDEYTAFNGAVLLGGPGNDVLRGGPSSSGSNSLDGGPGSDLIDAGPGQDWVSYSLVDSNRSVSITLDGVANDGPAGENDNVAGFEEVHGSEQADVLAGDAATTRIFGRGGNDTISGGSGDEEIDAGWGNDTVDGGAGNDLIRSGEGRATLRGGPGNDMLITQDYTSDVLDGGPGDDLLRGSGVGDTLLGGDGSDTVDYFDHVHGSNVAVDLDGQQGDDGSVPQPDIGYQGERDTVGADVENVIGTTGRDVLTGNAANNRLNGVRGGDVITGGAGVDIVDYGKLTIPVEVTLDGVANDGDGLGEPDLIALDVEGAAGGSAADVLVGNGDANVLEGGGGDDVLLGLGGPDTLLGGPGEADVAAYVDRIDAVRVDLADPAPDGNHLDGPGDTIQSDVEDVWGGAGPDLLAGNGLDNSLLGGPGADVLVGRDGLDYADYSERTIAVTVDLDGEAEDDGAPGERDTVGADVESIFGGDGNDVLAGNGSENVIVGGFGDDTIRLVDGVKDRAFCDDGKDTLAADRRDVHQGCETVDVLVAVIPLPRRAPPAPPPVAPAPLAPAERIVKASSALRKRELGVRIACAEVARGGCRVRVGVRALAAGAPAGTKPVALVARVVLLRPGGKIRIAVPRTLPRRSGLVLPVSLDVSIAIRAVEREGAPPARQELTLGVAAVLDEDGFRRRSAAAEPRARGAGTRGEAVQAVLTRAVAP